MWRQGSVLTPEAIEALKVKPLLSLEDAVAIVATHDCDLAQSPDSEPKVEVIIGHRIDVADKNGNYTYAKNSRKIHLQFDTNTFPTWVEFEAVSKILVVKEELYRFSADKTIHLNTENRAIFQKWLASRYRRSAFPDEFERRLKEAKIDGKISKAIKPYGEFIIGIFFDIDEGEEITHESSEDPYKLDIIILYTTEKFDNAEQIAQKVANNIEVIFEDKLFKPNNRWQNIELRSCEAVSESVLSYQIFKQLKSWRLESISLATHPQQPVLVE